MIEANEWDVTFEASDELIAADLKNWVWGGETDPASVAKTVFAMIREQTMADIDGNGVIAMGLFEHAMPLKVPLSALVYAFIENNVEADGRICAAASEASKLAGILAGLAAVIRSHLPS